MTKSIIEEIERNALDSNSSLSDLLRKSRVIASKLSLQQPMEWVDSELNGYSGEVPEYRILFGQAKIRNPYHGWQPVLFGNAEIQDMVCKQKIPNPIKELEHFVASKGDIVIPLSGQQSEIICQMADSPTLPISVFIAKNAILRILDIVRTRVLDWALSLQAAGIKGEGLSFSPTEKAVAHNPSITYQIGHIGNFSGNIGGNVGRDVNSNSTQNIGPELSKIADLIKQIRALEGQMGLSPTAQAEMRQHIEALHAEIQKPNPERGKLAGLLSSVKTIAEEVAGNVIAAGVTALASGIQL